MKSPHIWKMMLCDATADTESSPRGSVDYQLVRQPRWAKWRFSIQDLLMRLCYNQRFCLPAAGVTLMSRSGFNDILTCWNMKVHLDRVNPSCSNNGRWYREDGKCEKGSLATAWSFLILDKSMRTCKVSVSPYGRELHVFFYGIKNDVNIYGSCFLDTFNQRVLFSILIKMLWYPSQAQRSWGKKEKLEWYQNWNSFSFWGHI